MKFFFHYNKPQSKKVGKPQLSLHYKNICHIVDNIECFVPTTGRIRKSQPYFVMTGSAKSISIGSNRVAVIQ